MYRGPGHAAAYTASHKFQESPDHGDSWKSWVAFCGGQHDQGGSASSLRAYSHQTLTVAFSPDATSHNTFGLLMTLPQYAEQIIARLKDENGVLRYKVCNTVNVAVTMR